MFQTKDKILNFVYSLGAAVVILGVFFKMLHINVGFLSGNAILGLGLLVEASIFVVFAFNPPKQEYDWEKVYPELKDNVQPRAVAPAKNGFAAGGGVRSGVSLSEKLDDMLQQANLDTGVFERLSTGIQNFSDNVARMNTAVADAAQMQKYNDEISRAAHHLEQMNNLFQQQRESAAAYTEAGSRYAAGLEQSAQFTDRYNDEMAKASGHLQQMNKLYAIQSENTERYTKYTGQYVDDLEQSAEHTEKLNQELRGLTASVQNLNKIYGGMLNAMKG